MNKEIKITELMREYTDEEFNIEGENAADTEKVLESVMGQVKPKKRIKPLFKVLIAAAAAVCVAGGTVAASAFISKGTVTTAAGGYFAFDIQEDGSWKGGGSIGNQVDVVTMEDGRLYFNLNGKSTDITDLVDRTTPYIYSATVPETGEPSYIIAGGTPEEYGFVDLVYVEGIGWEGDGNINGDPVNSMIWVTIGKDSWGYAYEHGWYLTDESTCITYSMHIVDGGESFADFQSSGAAMLPTWRDEYRDAWIVEALLQLDLMKLPDAADFRGPELYVNDDGELIWKRHDGDEFDLTEKIGEDTPYIFEMVKGEHDDCYFVFGGTPEDYGWAVVSRYDDENWFIGGENLTDADGQLREWYPKAVEKIGFDLEQLQQNYYFSFE